MGKLFVTPGNIDFLIVGDRNLCLLVGWDAMGYLACRVEIVRQGLKSKSQWWRKCPLQVSSSSKALLNSEHSIMLFAEGSAAKEQWYVALRQACGLTAKQAVENAYARFCAQVRESRGPSNDYPQVLGCHSEAQTKAQALQMAPYSKPRIRYMILGGRVLQDMRQAGLR